MWKFILLLDLYVHNFFIFGTGRLLSSAGNVMSKYKRTGKIKKKTQKPGNIFRNLAKKKLFTILLLLFFNAA